MNAQQLRDRVVELAPELEEVLSTEFGEVVVDIEPEALAHTAEMLQRIGFKRLMMVTAVDYRDWIVMVYRFQSSTLSTSLTLKTKIPPSEPRIASLVPLWPAANWQEREVFDLFGVTFEGHPDMRRILLEEDFQGHPLLKDYDDPSLIRRPDYI